MKKKISSLQSNLVKALPIHRFTYMLMMIFFILLFSCSGADPIIYELETRLQSYWRYPFESQERLLVQILADDDDGFDEIYEVYIINDEAELYWRATRDEWDLIRDDDDQQWIVLTRIYSERRDTLPRGRYKLVLMDYSGFRANRFFYVDDPINDDKSYFPILIQEEGYTYVPISYVLPNNADEQLYLELSHPDIVRDIAGNEQIDEFEKNISLLGESGNFFKIEKNVPIQFVLEQKSRANVFLHYLSQDGMLFTSGPFELDFQ